MAAQCLAAVFINVVLGGIVLSAQLIVHVNSCDFVGQKGFLGSYPGPAKDTTSHRFTAAFSLPLLVAKEVHDRELGV